MPRVAVVTGPAGIGKTALALLVAHELRSAFTDGQLHASLGGAADEWRVLRQLLEAFGFQPRELPDDVELQAELYQSLLATRRMLVVLDDVRSVEQARLLLPRGINCGALLTMRSRLPDLPDAHTVRLELLEERDALDLLRRIAGAPFVDNYPDAAGELVRQVGRLPFALQIMAAAARESDADAPTLLQRLGSELGPRDIAEPLYESLPEDQRRLLRLLTVLPEPEFDSRLAAEIAELDQEAAATAVRSLAGSALLQPSGVDRYRLPDLIQQFARERLAAEETQAEQRAALDRAIRWIAISTAYRPEAPLTRDYWTHEDTLGHAPYADAIASFIQHPGTRPPLTIGIKAPWGAGKTSLMRMVQQRLDPRAELDTWSPTRLRLNKASRQYLHSPAGRTRTGGRGRWSKRWLRTEGNGAEAQVTNLELLRRASQPSALETAEVDHRLDVDPPAVSELRDRGGRWRPTVWFNPWMYQSGEQIWAGLAHEIITQVTERLVAGDRERFWLELNLRRIDRQAVRRRVYRLLFERFLPLVLALVAAALLSAAAILAGLVFPPVARTVRAAGAALVSTTGATVAILAVVQTVRFLKDKAAGPFSPLLRSPDLVKGSRSLATAELKGSFGDVVSDPGYEAKLGFLHLIQTDMKRVLGLVATEQRPLVVFVDDLDRCSPGAVAQVIEAINLFLAGQFPNCIFVLAMDPAVVAAHVEVVYKDLAENLRLDRLSGDRLMLGWRFLEKIVQLPLSLPPPDAGDEALGYVVSLLDGPTERMVTAPPGDGAEQPASRDEGQNGAPGQGAKLMGTSMAQTSLIGASEPSDTDQETARADFLWRLEVAIRRRLPTVESLPAVAREAQEEVLGVPGGQVRHETMEAANRVLVEVYSDDQARTAILDLFADARDLVPSNPGRSSGS